MTTGVACPNPILQFFNNAGQPNVGGTILTQVGGVNAATYQDSGLTTALPNPIPLNSRGEVSNASGTSCQLFLTPNVVYTLTMFDANGNQLNQATYVDGVQVALTATSVGQALYPQSAQESLVGVTPANFGYPPGDIRRYGAVGDGSTDNSAYLVTANSVGEPLSIPPGSYSIASAITLSVPLNFQGGTLLPASGITTTINATVVAGLQKIFDQSAGGTIAGKIKAPAIYPEWFGALGNGKRGNNGTLVIASAAFTDANASFASSDVGKYVFIVPPPYTALATVLTTIAAYVSATAITLTTAPSWASSASYSATIAGTTMTVPGAVTGTILPGQSVTGSGVTASTTVLYQLTGTTGAGSGATYKVSISQTVSSSTAMTGTYALTYYYGTDDSVAINAANALVGSQGVSLGSTANVGGQPSYNLDNLNGTLSFTGPNIYLMTQQAVIGGPINTTAHRWEGLQGRPTIAICINSAVTDCVVLGAGSALTGGVGTATGAGLSDLIIDCCFAGRDGVVLGGFEMPRLKNVYVFNAQRDNLSITPQVGSFIQQGIFEGFQAINAGRHTIYVKVASGSFANECNFNTCVTGSPSQRQAGGASLYFDSMASESCDTWSFNVTKFTNGWNGDTNYLPSLSPIVIASGTVQFAGSGLKLINCYCEQSGTAIGASAPAIKVVGAAQGSNVQADGFAAFGWGVDLDRSRFDGGSIFTVANGSSQDICVLGTGQVWNGEVLFYLNDGTNGTYDRRAFSVLPGINGAITALGTVSNPAAVTYTISANASSGSTHITVNNTGAVPLTLQYSALTKHRASGAGFVY